jgi:hypothetical protein
MDYTEAFTALDAITSGKVADTEAALRETIHVYRSLGMQVKELEALQARAKQLASEIMQETGQTKAITPAGTASFAAASERVSWDSKALDALCASDELIALILLPHRKVTQVAGGLTIK